MTNTIFRFLKQPYPFYLSGKNLTVLAVVIFLMSLSFNYLFLPFDVYVPEHRMDYFWISLIHSCTTLVVFLLWLPVTIFLPNLDEGWTIGKEITFIGSYLLLVGIGQFLLRDVLYDNPYNWSWHYLFEEIRNTFMVGVLFIFILVPLNYSRLNRKHIKKARHLGSMVNSKGLDNPAILFIKTNVKGDDFQLPVSGFLFAKAERNYIELFLKKDGNIEKLLKRISISDLQSQLSVVPHIARTHRSYLVNLLEVGEVSGNAQGYKLRLKSYPDLIPVSRNMIARFESKMQTL